MGAWIPCTNVEEEKLEWVTNLSIVSIHVTIYSLVIQDGPTS